MITNTYNKRIHGQGLGLAHCPRSSPKGSNLTVPEARSANVEADHRKRATGCLRCLHISQLELATGVWCWPGQFKLQRATGLWCRPYSQLERATGRRS